MSELKSLSKLSARLGANHLLVQAAGGNTSLKQDGIMWIKASGTWLKDADDKDIFVPLDYEKLKSALTANDPDCESCVAFIRTDLNVSGLRPSIETSVHGLMPQKVVLHVHCVNTISWAIQENAEALLSEKLAGENWVFIPYARPGLMLSKAIQQNIKPNTNVLILGNHGLVVAAETVHDAETLLQKIVRKLKRTIRSVPRPDLAALTAIVKGTNYQPATNDGTHALAYDALAFKVGTQGVFYPDHVVFLGTTIPYDFSSDGPAVLIRRKGVLVHKNAKAAVEPMLRCLADVFRRVDANAKLNALTPEQIDQLLNWDAEKYRQTLKAN